MCGGLASASSEERHGGGKASFLRCQAMFNKGLGMKKRLATWLVAPKDVHITYSQGSRPKRFNK